jgi:hypothetical protein
MTIPPKEIRQEVELAKAFPRPLSEYFIFTTAKKSRLSQLEVLDICAEHAAAGLFPVRLLCWDDIERMIDNSPAAKMKLGIREANNFSFESLTRTLL